MKRLVLLGALALASLIFGIATGMSLYYRAFYALALALLGAWALARLNLLGLAVEVERKIHSATVGDAIAERITVSNTSVIPKAWLEIEDQTTLRENSSSLVISLGARGFRSWNATLKADRRGVYRLGPVRATSSDPLGVFTLSRTFTQSEEMVVYPATVSLPHLRLLATETVGEGSVRLRSHQVTPHAGSVREYRPGDPLSRIHWPSTARTGRLMAKEFDLGVGAGLWLVVDMHRAVQRGEGAETTDEMAATIAASIAQRYLLTNMPVGLLAFGDARAIVPPERGEGQLRQVLEQLARVRAEGRVPLEQALGIEGNRFDRSATVVVITPSLDPGWVGMLIEMQRRNVRGAAILLDATSFGGEGSPTRVREALAHAGILSYVVRKGDNLSEALAFAHARTVSAADVQPQESLL